MFSNFLRVVIFPVLMFLCLYTTSAQSLLISQKIIPSDREISDLFGGAMDISGDYAIVGASENFVSNNGTAYIYKRDNSGSWVQQQLLLASDGSANDQFGTSVAIAGSTAVVSAVGEDEDASGSNTASLAGAAYIFEMDSSGSWVEVQKIVASDREADDYFGQSVGMTENYIIVGAWGEDASGLNSAGAAYIFERDSTGAWVEKQKLTATTKQARAHFGFYVTVQDNAAIISAKGEVATIGGNTLNYAGAAYVFLRDSSGAWTETQKLVSSDLNDSDNFGGPLAIHGSKLVIGANGDDEDASGLNYKSRSGSAYIFELDSSGIWVEKQKIVASDREMNREFGRASIEMSDSILVVAAILEDENGLGTDSVYQAGAAYIFRLNNAGVWVEEQKVTAAKRSIYDEFGSSVAISGNQVLIGMQYDDYNERGSEELENAGSVFVFEYTNCAEPIFTSQPTDSAIIENDTVAFGLSAVQQSSYQWQENSGSGFSDITDGGTYSGATTDTLRLYNVPMNKHGYTYRCIVSSACLLNVISDTALLSVNITPPEQMGQVLEGESSSDYFGYSLSMTDNNLIVGAYGDDALYPNSGHARVYRWNGSGWVQKGADIDGEEDRDYFGLWVSMAKTDTNTVAIGARNSNGGNAGRVKMYTWNGTSWVQKGQSLTGDAASDYFGATGYSISMPDANTVGVGGARNDGNGVDAGHVKIFAFNGVSWVQKGADIEGDSAGDYSGKISMPDANTIAIGAELNDGNGADAGQIRIYQWNGTSWIQKGADLYGDIPGDNAGHSVTMPDANTVAYGAQNYDQSSSLINSGRVKVFTWNGSSWVQKGGNLDGASTGELFGASVNMPDANTIAVGSTKGNHPGFSGTNNTGYVQIFRWKNNQWVRDNDIFYGDAQGDDFGRSVCMPNNRTIAIGGDRNDGNGSDAGHVKVFKMGDCISSPITSTPSINGTVWACELDVETYSVATVAGANSYVWTVPSGATVISGQGTNSVSVEFGSGSGNVTVTPYNECGDGGPTSSLTVTVQTSSGLTTFTKYVSDIKYGKQKLWVATPPTTATNVYVLPQKKTGGTSYTVQISPDAQFGSDIQSKTGNVSADWYFLNLLPGTTYYSRANVNNGCYGPSKPFQIEGLGSSKLGKTYDLTYGWQEGNSNPTTSTNVYCRPTPVAGATQYTVEVNPDPNFSAVSAITRVGAQWDQLGYYYFDSLAANTTYYVRVMTDNEGVWGESRTFVTDSGMAARPMARQTSSRESGAETSRETRSFYTLFPNPFTDRVNIRVDSEKEQNLTITVSDLSGKVVYQSSRYQTNQTIEIGSELENGIYVIQLMHGNNVKAYKVVKN